MKRHSSFTKDKSNKYNRSPASPAQISIVVVWLPGEVKSIGMEIKCCCQKMMDQAEEDLQQLESQHPHRFNYLKLELRSFILLLESQHSLLHHENPKTTTTNSSSSSPAATQASTCRKRKNADSQHKDQEVMDDNTVKGEDRVGVVLRRAKCCLRKLQEFKTTLC